MRVTIILTSGAKFKFRAKAVRVTQHPKDGTCTSYEFSHTKYPIFPMFINPAHIDAVIVKTWFGKQRKLY